MKDRIFYLDGLRGLAAMLVLFGHFLEQVNVIAYPHLLDGLLDWTGFGRIGVVTFFCISGFVIPFSFQSRRPIVGFAVSRFFRLYPAYWLSIAVAVALAAIFSVVPSYTTILANFTMIQGGFGYPDIISVYWTLLIEMAFYVLCVILYAGKLLDRPVAIALLVTVICVAAMAGAVARHFALSLHVPVGLTGYIAIMLLGSLIRHARINDDRTAASLLPWILTVVAITIAVIGVFGYDRTNMPERPLADFLGVYVGIGLFLFADRAKNWLSRTPMRWLGQISYSLYLLHAPCVFLMYQLALPFSHPLAKLGLLALSLPLSLIVADASYRYIERPMVALGKRLWFSPEKFGSVGM